MGVYLILGNGLVGLHDMLRFLISLESIAYELSTHLKPQQWRNLQGLDQMRFLTEQPCFDRRPKKFRYRLRRVYCIKPRWPS